MKKKVLRSKKTVAALLGIALCNTLLFAQTASPAAVVEDKPKQGIDFHGQIGTYLLTTFGKLTPDGSSETNSTIANGLLPASLSALPYFEKGDLRVTGNITAYVSQNNFVAYNGTISDQGVGGTTAGGDGGALQTNFVEFMQAFAQITHKKYGTFLLGRDFGLFAKDAAFQDISVLGVGVSRATAIPRQVHDLGLGYGYVFCDKYPQINYTTPSLGGLTITLGAYQPLNQTQSGGSLGLQGKLAFVKDISPSTNLYISASFINQKIIKATSTQNELRGTGFDVFAKIKTGGFALSGQFNTGSGLGYYGLFLGATKTDNGKTVTASSSGYYVQASYSLKKGFTTAVNYGSSTIEKGGWFGGSDGSATSRFTISLSQPIGAFLLRAEFTNMSKNPLLGVVADRNLLALGGTFLF